MTRRINRGTCIGAPLLLALLCGELAMAGECRKALRPLLSRTSPNVSQLNQVRALCEREARDGDADASYHLSLFHLGLTGWSPEIAVPMIRAAAHRGVPEAQYWLAWQYESGPLLEDDAVQALRWYLAAGNSEHRLALERLAEAHAKGELGLAINQAESIRLHALAASCRQ